MVTAAGGAVHQDSDIRQAAELHHVHGEAGSNGAADIRASRQDVRHGVTITGETRRALIKVKWRLRPAIIAAEVRG